MTLKNTIERGSTESSSYRDYDELMKRRDGEQPVGSDFIWKRSREGAADIRGNEQGRKKSRKTALDTVSCD